MYHEASTGKTLSVLCLCKNFSISAGATVLTFLVDTCNLETDVSVALEIEDDLNMFVILALSDSIVSVQRNLCDGE